MEDIDTRTFKHQPEQLIQIYIYIYIYIYIANCINFGKPKHIVKKARTGKDVTMKTLINLNTLDWPTNEPKKHIAYLH